MFGEELSLLQREAAGDRRQGSRNFARSVSYRGGNDPAGTAFSDLDRFHIGLASKFPSPFFHRETEILARILTTEVYSVRRLVHLSDHLEIACLQPLNPTLKLFGKTKSTKRSLSRSNA